MRCKVDMSPFSNATLLITGGTGSFGNTVLKHFLTTDIGQIRIFSRDEKKQDDMRHELQSRYPDHAGKVKFYIGDVRDIRSARDAMPGVKSKKFPLHLPKRTFFTVVVVNSGQNRTSLPLCIKYSAMAVPAYGAMYCKDAGSLAVEDTTME